MNYQQLERHYKLLDLIDQYEMLVERYSDGCLKARNSESIAGSTRTEIDSIGDIVIKKERAEEKLNRLKALRDTENAEIEKQVNVILSGNKKNKIRSALVYRLRYLEGMSIAEIAEIIGNPYKNKQYLIVNLLKQCAEEEGK